MTAVASPLRALNPAPHTFAGLARCELRRFTANPLFLLGAALAWLASATVGGGPFASVDQATPYTAISLGGLSMIAACRQTQSLQPASAVVDATPVPLPLRSAALCTIAIGPLLGGIASLLLFRSSMTQSDDFALAAFGPSTRTAVLVSKIVLPSLGGPLLGVALGRWIRFPGVGVVAFLLLEGWVLLVTAVSVSSPDQTWAVSLRLLAPFAFFVVIDHGAGSVTTWRGSPSFFIGWQLALCLLAVLAALLRGAEGTVRRRIVGALRGVSIGAAILLVLAVQGGVPQAVTHAVTR